jgi:VanZ family protein
MEIRAVIQYLWANRVLAARINVCHVEVYGETAMLHHNVIEVCRMFRAGRENTNYDILSGLTSALTAEVIILTQ